MKNKQAEMKVLVEYEDVNKMNYEALCYVTVNSSYEVEDVRFSIIEVFDETGEPIEIVIEKQIFEQLSVLAGAKALEKVESVDFEKEAERE